MRSRMAGITKKFIDIGANLTDEMYQGVYHGSKKHEPDLELVLKRAWEGGLTKMIITGTSLSDSKTALELAKTNNNLYSTVGCHPTRCGEFEKDDTTPETYLENLLQLALDNRQKVVAIGECGLDYDRTQFCAPEIQRKYFEEQISLAEVTGLPMFLHCRNSAADLVKILSSHREKIKGGVVHSFDGTKEEAQQIMDLDLYIGLNGCSLKTAENLAVAASIPAERLMIETDCPWCEIRPTHAGHKHVKTTFPNKKKEKWESGVMVKSRNEPNCIVQVLEVLAGIREEDADMLAETFFKNTQKLFFNSENV
ncbi:deoxyribonuclease TATDN1 isoform X3 [Penaeus vannamei]|nr:putative deoxyribonuclease TATDN1 isoform X5 [Penaeus vannamei]XP_027234109.1 putative deoxyribonuclease TATDN1 isoform X5 [Penaeus vannamei]